MDRGSLTLLRIRGIPIRVHWSLLLAVPYLAWVFSAQFAGVAHVAGEDTAAIHLPPLLIGAILVLGLFASILLHELAHSLVALRRGGKVRSITLLLLGGISQIEQMPRRPRDEAVVAAVGPATSLGLAGVLFALHALTPHGVGDARVGLFYLANLNLVLGIFNLLPAFPMDGGRVLRALLAARSTPARATAIAAGIGKVLAVGLGLLGLWGGNWLLMLIAVFVYTGAQAEALREHAREALEGVRVGEVMLRHPVTVGAHTPLAEVPGTMQATGRLELVVVNTRGQPVGVLRAADVAAIPPEQREDLRISDLGAQLASRVAVATPQDGVTEAMERARIEGADTLLVIDPAVGLVGLVGRTELEHALTLRSTRGHRRPPGPTMASRPHEA